MNTPLIPLLTYAIGPHVGEVLTPELAAHVTALVASLAYPGPVDISQCAPRPAGSYVLRAERMADVVDEMRPLHLAHWLETEGHRNTVQELAMDYDGIIDFEKRGRFALFTARTQEGQLVGNGAAYIMPSMHTGALIAREDTLFILKEHRGRLGVALIRYIEDMLKVLGVRELTVTVKLVNAVGQMIQRMGYQHVAAEYVKQF